jgi:epoxyqueuosine reductase
MRESCQPDHYEREDLTPELAFLAEQLGADLFGVADLRPAREFMFHQGGEGLEAFTHGIAIGIGVSYTVVDRIAPELPADHSVYGHHLYRVVSPAVDSIAWHLARRIQERGYSALPIPVSQYRAPGERSAVFSHKLAGHLAGLGWIGKNCLLITPQFGPRVRLASVLTDCPLRPGQRLDDRCGECQECVDACPVHALTGVEFRDEEGLEARLRAEVCGAYRDGKGNLRSGHVCGLCLAVCPKAYPQDRRWRHHLREVRDRKPPLIRHLNE